MNEKTGVLLVNLGTPDSPAPSDVKKYLTEFLTDPRVIDIPFVKRQLLVRGVIIPRRYKSSAEAYRHIWTKEGSPLMVYGRTLEKKLSEALPSNVFVKLAMRYQTPSIKSALEDLLSKDLDHLIVLPLFPQYASATTGSIIEKVMEEISSLTTFPKLTFIRSFHDHPKMIEAFADRGTQANWEDYDHILFSFHGLPERQLKTADRGECCMKKKDCCKSFREENRHCYSAQCYATAAAIVARLGIPEGRYTICFQSRLGADPWIEPYASDVIKQLAAQKCKRVLSFCPAFVCDCLETLFEFGEEYQQEFQKLGGEKLDLVPGLNDGQLWIEAVLEIISDYLPSAQEKVSL